MKEMPWLKFCYRIIRYQNNLNGQIAKQIVDGEWWLLKCWGICLTHCLGKIYKFFANKYDIPFLLHYSIYAEQTILSLEMETATIVSEVCDSHTFFASTVILSGYTHQCIGLKMHVCLGEIGQRRLN